MLNIINTFVNWSRAWHNPLQYCRICAHFIVPGQDLNSFVVILIAQFFYRNSQMTSWKRPLHGQKNIYIYIYHEGEYNQILGDKVYLIVQEDKAFKLNMCFQPSFAMKSKQKATERRVTTSTTAACTVVSSSLGAEVYFPKQIYILLFV